MFPSLRIVRRLVPVFIYVLFASLAAARTGAAQQAGTPGPVVRGTVTDSTRRAIVNVSVTVTDSTKRVLGTALTQDDGTFEVDHLPAHTAFRVVARRIGLTSKVETVRPIANGDTVTLHFVLAVISHTLTDVNIHGKRDVRAIIDSAAIYKLPARTAADVLQWSHLTRIGAFKMCPGFDRVIIDGQQLPNWEEIDSDSIATMEYIDCWDRDRPTLRNTLVIRLKHPRPLATPVVFSPQPRPAPRPVDTVPPAPPAPPVLVGTVTDTAHRALSGVSLTVSDSAKHVVATLKNAPDGSFRIPNLAAGMPYAVSARRIGFAAHTENVRPLAAGDSLALHFVLRDTTHSLALVRVHASRENRPYKVDSSAIGKLPAIDAYDVTVRNPWLLGDWFKMCRPDTSHLMNGTDTDDVREKPQGPTRGERQDMRNQEPLRLFVDGQLRAEQSIKNTLADIPSDTIASMEYVSCWDKERPTLRNSLVIILKHSKAPSTQVALSPQPPPGMHVDSAPSPVIIGTVTDTLRRKLSGAEVVVKDSAQHVVASGRSAADGSFRFNTLTAGVAYDVLARRIGFAARTLHVRPLTAGDTVSLHFAMADTTHTLAPVNVHASREARPYKVDSNAIAQLPAIDAYDVAVRNPWLLGDWFKMCRPDTSHLMNGSDTDDTRERVQGPSYREMVMMGWVADTSSSALSSGSSSRGRSRNNNQTPTSPPPAPTAAEPLRLFVDGQLRAEQSVKNSLADIPSDTIASMEYVSCWDKERPQLRNSLVIILKHSAAKATQAALSQQPSVQPVGRQAPGAIDTAFHVANPSLAGVVGVVIDSLHGAALSNAVVEVSGTGRFTTADAKGRYHIDSIPPGTHSLSFFHPLLDTLGFAINTTPVQFTAGQVQRVILAVPSPLTVWHKGCGADTVDKTKVGSDELIVRRTEPAAILGRIVDADDETPVPGVSVTLTWQELLVSRSEGMRHVKTSRTAKTDAGGAFRLCGVPGPVQGTLQATIGMASTGTVPLNVGGGDMLLQQLSLDTAGAGIMPPPPPTDSDAPILAPPPRTGRATVTGKVVASNGAVLQNAVVSIVGAAGRGITDEKGMYTLDKQPGGTQTLMVRAIGYSPAQIVLNLNTRTPARQDAVLTLTPATLATVNIKGAALKAAYKKIGFSDREKTGFGHFLNDSAVAQRAAGATLVADLFSGVPGVRVNYPSQGDPYLVSSRGGGCVAYVIDDVPVLASSSPSSSSSNNNSGGGGGGGGGGSGGRGGSSSGGSSSGGSSNNSSSSQGVDIEQYVHVNDIGAIEIYQPSEVPGEFAVSGQTSCVTVVIWTKAKLSISQ